MNADHRPGAGIARFIYNHNPFYPMSAGLMLYGLSSAFAEGDSTSYSWMLFGSMAGYTALLVAAAALIVRWGKVWNDARTIICTVAIMITVLSSSFDQRLIESPMSGVPVLVAGLAIAAALSEVLLRGTRIRLGRLYRTAWYLQLANLFLYPVLLNALLTYLPRGDAAVSLGLMAFPYLSAALFIPLVVATRRGASYAADSGTPWRWPLFPLSIFVLLAGSVAVRSYMLTLSFYPAHGMATPWDWHFLAPLVAVAAAVVVELAIALKSRIAETLALYGPAAVFVASLGFDPPGRLRDTFVGTISAHVASPVFLALLCALALYVYAAARGVSRARRWVVASLLALTVTGPYTAGLASLTPIQSWPLAVVLALLVAEAVRTGTSRAAMAASLAGVALLWSATRSAWFVAYAYALPAHLMLVAALVAGAWYTDAYAGKLRLWCAYAFGLLPIVAIAYGRGGDHAVPLPLLLTYLLAVAAATTVGWLYTGALSHLVSVCVQVGWAAGWGTWALFELLASPAAPRGAAYMVAGACLFVVAVAISTAKGGGLTRLREAPKLMIESSRRRYRSRYLV